MVDDPKIAKEFVDQEFDTHARILAKALKDNPRMELALWSAESGPPPAAENFDATYINMIIGARHELTRENASKAAKAYLSAVQRYPKADVYINLLGYDADPREIWEIPDAAQYVRLWARLAGLNHPRDVKVNLVVGGVGFLGACGCWGEAYRQEVIRRYRAQWGQVKPS